MSLKHKIRALREKNNLSQQELAAKIGVNPSAVCHWESGNRKPTLDNVFRLAAAFDVTVGELFDP